MPRMTLDARRALVEERRKQILTAAAQVFAEKGFDRATIQDVAQAAGLAQGSIYNYFKNKQDLLIHLPRLFIQPRFQALLSGTADGELLPPEELLSFIAHSVVGAIVQNREMFRVLLTSLPRLDDSMIAEYVKDVPGDALVFFENYIRTKQAEGVFRADLDPAIAARVFPGMMMFFLLIQELLQPRDLPRFEFERVIPQVVRIYLHGVMAKEISNP